MKEKLQRSEHVITGLTAAVLITVLLLYILFSAPALNMTVDYSCYNTLDTLGISWVGGVQRFGEVVTEFAWTKADPMAFAKCGTSSQAAAAAVVRLVSQPFGQPFRTQTLAVVYILLIAAGCGLLTAGLGRHSRVWAACGFGAVVMLCSHSTLMCCLNSLYTAGAAIAFLLLFIGCVIHAFCLPRGCGLRHMAGCAAAGILTLMADAQMIAFLPAVIVILCLLTGHCAPQGLRKELRALVCAAAIVLCLIPTLTGITSNSAIVSGAADYQAVFQGYLPSCDDPAAMLKELQLPDEMLADVGRSYYDDESLFAVNPRDEKNSALLEKITPLKRALLCLKHPELVTKRISAVSDYFYDSLTGYAVTADGQTGYVRPSAAVLSEMLFGRSGFWRMTCFMLFALVAGLLLAITAGKHRGHRYAGISIAVMALCGVIWLPLDVVLTGGIDISTAKMLFFALGWLGLYAGIASSIVLVKRMTDWLGTPGSVLSAKEAFAAERPVPVTERGVNRIALTAVTAVVCFAIGCGLLLPERHIAGVNNGDYGRMMDMLGIGWEGERALDYSLTYDGSVVEQYTYKPGLFSIANLTSLDPVYSLAYPAAVVRLWSLISGSGYSTQLQAMVLLMLTVFAIALIVYDLTPLLKRWCIPLAVLLCLMLLGDNYIAWYNSFFGEGCISVGVLMTTACALHLTVMERGSKASWIWLLLLGFFVRFMVTAKAQMLLSIPFGLLLIGAMAVWHHPKGAAKLTAWILTAVVICGLVSYDTLCVYRKNAERSEEATLWQSVFYGLLMVADDPAEAMEELGIDPVMAPDIGKHAYLDPADYVYAPDTPEAKAAFYDHVSTADVVFWYLRHPGRMLYMLDYAATQSVTLHTGFMTYTGENYYAERVEPCSFSLWRDLRTWTASPSFYGYLLVYGITLIWCLTRLFGKKTAPRDRLLVLLFLCLMGIGAFQYPLSVLGNGFADNNKQMYCFMLCHDLMLVTGLCFICSRIGARAQRVPEGA